MPAVLYSSCMATEVSNVEHIRGQMTVDECIDVATSGSDGKPVVTPDYEPPAPRPPRPKTVAEIVAERLGKEQ